MAVSQMRREMRSEIRGGDDAKLLRQTSIARWMMYLMLQKVKGVELY